MPWPSILSRWHVKLETGKKMQLYNAIGHSKTQNGHKVGMCTPCRLAVPEEREA